MSASLNDTLKKYLEGKGVTDVDTITGFEDEAYVTSGGCDTCGWGSSADITSWIYYNDTSGKKQVYTVRSSFSDLLQELLSV